MVEASDGGQVRSSYRTQTDAKLTWISDQHSSFPSTLNTPVSRSYTKAEAELTIRQEIHMEDPYVEIIGTVREDGTVKALTSINLGKSLGTRTCLHRRERVLSG